ncbi:hypothetical protein ACROYT_G027502 [Oculina patagonica]
MSGDLNASCKNGTPDINLSQTAIGIQSTAILLLSVSSLICNALVGFVLLKKPELLSHSSTKLLLNLSASSFILSLTVLPFVFASSLKQSWIFGDKWCQANGFLTVLLSATSLGMVMFLSIDRYHCIVNPLNYANRMSPTRTNFFISCTWLGSLFLALLPLVGWGKYGYQPAKVSCTVIWSDSLSEGYTKLYSLVTLFGPLLVMVGAYYYILKAARRQARVGQIAVLPASIVRPRTNRNSIASNTSVFTGSKALRTTFLVLGTVIFCWGPYVIAILLESEQICVGYELQTTFVMVSYSSALLYPVIYGFHIRAIRRNIKRLVASLFLCGNHNIVRPASDTGFVVSPQAWSRNRSASEGSVNSFEMAWSPRRESESIWSLPAIKEERENVPNTTKSTDLVTDLEVCNLPGTCV